MKQGKGSEKKNATKKKANKATASGSSDGDSSAESSAPEEGTYAAPELLPGAGGPKESACHLEVVLREENIHRDASWMSVLCN